MKSHISDPNHNINKRLHKLYEDENSSKSLG